MEHPKSMKSEEEKKYDHESGDNPGERERMAPKMEKD